MIASAAPAMGGLRRLFAKKEDPYAGADLANAKRYAGFVWVSAGLIALGLLPFAPPTAQIGPAGWAVVALLLTGSAFRTWLLFRPNSRIDFDGLYAGSYSGLAAVALMVWLTGGQGSHFAELYALGAVYSAGIHPLRRLVPYMALVTIAMTAPLAYGGWSRHFLAEALTQLGVLTTLVIANFAAMSRVRFSRQALRLHGEQAERLARIDSLTGLGNRRSFDELLEREFARTKRNDEALSLVVFDLDGFKRLNDDFGHSHGDECLRAVADVLRRVMRRSDLCFRWGGDEFAALLPQSELLGSQLAAERVGSELDRLSHRLASPVTVSYGVADGGLASTPEHLIALADEALLRAKRDRDGLSSSFVGDTRLSAS
ncbi:MAG: GGDEF domain-containing protein [Thermoleophilaceae bacterium]